MILLTKLKRAKSFFLISSSNARRNGETKSSRRIWKFSGILGNSFLLEKDDMVLKKSFKFAKMTKQNSKSCTIEKESKQCFSKSAEKYTYLKNICLRKKHASFNGFSDLFYNSEQQRCCSGSDALQKPIEL